jgi:hypothetical protein
VTTSDGLPGDSPGSGIFRQVADTLVDLTRAARTGAQPEAIRVAHMALRDQWEAAANDATEAGAGSVDRFETVAAALCVDAYRPALESLSLGRDATRELETARDALRCLIRARDAFVVGDPTMVRRWFRLAEITVAMEAERSAKDERD